jgi:hypothetical protein
VQWHVAEVSQNIEVLTKRPKTNRRKSWSKRFKLELTRELPTQLAFKRSLSVGDYNQSTYEVHSCGWSMKDHLKLLNCLIVNGSCNVLVGNLPVLQTNNNVLSVEYETPSRGLITVAVGFKKFTLICFCTHSTLQFTPGSKVSTGEVNEIIGWDARVSDDVFRLQYLHRAPITGSWQLGSHHSFNRDRHMIRAPIMMVINVSHKEVVLIPLYSIKCCMCYMYKHWHSTSTKFATCWHNWIWL